jgi:MoaA/NifB/PqqE/SkfB family radical SAM enzyme
VKVAGTARRAAGIPRFYQLGKNLYGGAQKKLLRHGRALWPPISVIFISTHRCNYRCKMCFIQAHGFPEGTHPSEMTTDEIFKVLDQIPQISVCTFSGGEPLLRKDMLHVIAHATQTKRCHIITNGLLLHERNAETLLSLGAKSVFHKGLVVIGVSLMGNEVLHDEISNCSGSYQVVLNNVRQLQDIKRSRGQKFPKIDLKTPISKTNAYRLSLIGEAIEAIRPDYITLQVESSIQSPCYYTEPLDETAADKFRPMFDEYPRAIGIEDLQAVTEQIDIVKAHADNLGVEMRTYPRAPSRELVRHFRSELDLRRYGCISPWTDLFINPYGQAVSCMGCGFTDLRKLPVREAWNASFLAEIRTRMSKNGIPKACRGCCFLQYRPHHVI